MKQIKNILMSIRRRRDQTINNNNSILPISISYLKTNIVKKSRNEINKKYIDQCRGGGSINWIYNDEFVCGLNCK